MANLQKRGSYTPRSTRQQRAYRLVKLGSFTGAAGIGTLVLAVAGVLSAALPIILLLITAVIAWRFTRVTGQR
jgi:hypothetical protein